MKEATTAQAGETAGKKGPPYPAGANLGFSMEVPQRTEIELLYDPVTSLLGAHGSQTKTGDRLTPGSNSKVRPLVDLQLGPASTTTSQEHHVLGTKCSTYDT